MKKISLSVSKNKYLFFMLFANTLLFLLLYRGMIFGEYMYAYKDIGRDTIATYIPNMLMQAKWLSGSQASGYALQFGLGGYIQNPLSKYILPFDFLLRFVNSDNIGTILLLALYIKILLISVFSYLYFKKILDDGYIAALAGAMWTFCSYMVVWGQHYQYATLIFCLILGMYFLEAFLEGEKQGIFLVPALAVICLEGYYFLYLCGIFFVIYTIFRSVFYRERVRNVIKKIAALAGMALAGCAIAAVRLIPEIQDFLASTRMSDVTAEQRKVPFLFGRGYFLTFLGRLFSANTLGIGNSYSGEYNYYEAALLSVSLLAFFAVVLLLNTEYKKRVIGILIAVLCSLMFPAVSQIWNMNPLKQRWSFVLCFLEVLSVAFAMHILITGIKEGDVAHWKNILRRTVIWTDLLCVLLLGILVIAHKLGWITLYKKTVITICIFLVLYSVLLLFILRWERKIAACVMALLLLAELFVMNDASINDSSRYIVKKTEWETEYYNDGTIKLVDEIKQTDDSLYRINKTYYSVGENDALVQGYNGLMIYSSLNSRELVHFYLSSGYELTNGFSHWLSIPCYDFYLNSLLGTKYLIAREGEVAESAEYTLVAQSDLYFVYKNNYALPFGYLYETQLDGGDVLELDRVERQMALTYGFYMTDGENGLQNGAPESDEIIQKVGRASHEEILSNLEQLRQNGMTGITFEKSALTGEIENRTEKEEMLAIPVIFDKNWNIYVDGEQKELYDINGGLTGTWIDPGKHQIRLVYEKPLEKASVMISIAAVCLFALFCILYFRKEKLF